MNKHLKTAVAALTLVAAPLTYNAVMAQQTGQTSVVQQAVDYSKTFIQKLAGALGIEQSKLESALKNAGNSTVDEMLKNQDITRTQADALKNQIAQGKTPFFHGGSPRDRHGFGRGNPRAGHGMNAPMGIGLRGADISQISLLESAAKALNLSITQLDAQLRAGQTLISLATIQKVNLETVKNAVVGNLKAQLDAAIKAGKLTQAQADQILANANTSANFGLFGGRVWLVWTLNQEPSK
ncbi:MAG: hypothetical protein ACK41E_03880 [Deinococcales bacterium]